MQRARSLLAVLAVLGLTLSAPASLTAQSADTAAVLGTVADSQGAVLPGATVTATNVETGIVRTDVTAKEGTYRLRAVPPGRYEIAAELSGFQTIKRTGVVLSVGAEATINFTLPVAGVTETVNVEANAPIVNTTNATVGANLQTRQLELLPTISRDYRDFLRVVSGTTPTDQGVAFFGARAASNNWQIDGVDNTADSSGLQKMSPQIDTIAEFQVLTNSFKAEYGHAAGGVVNAITRSGTNVFHGSAFSDYRDEHFRAWSPFDDRNKPKTPFKRLYTGGTVGGPIKQNKGFFFGAYERLNQDENREATWVLPPASALSPKTAGFFSSYGVDPAVFGSGGSQRFITARPYVSDKLMTRFDFELRDDQSLEGRYNLDRNHQSDDKTGTIFDTTDTTSRAQNNDFNVNHKWTLSNTRLNEFYFLYTHNSFSSINNANMPIVFVPGFIGDGTVNLGGNLNYPQSSNQNRVQVKEHFLWTHNNHDVKVGGEVRVSREAADVENLYSGMYIFPNLQFLQSGFAVRLVQQVGNPSIPLNDNIFGAFIQDDWRPKSTLTLSLGLRYDYQIARVPPLGATVDYGGLLPSHGGEDPAISRDKNNFAPRFGFVWAPDASQAVYGGTGMYYDQVILNNFVSALFTPPYRAIYQINVPPFPTPVTSFGALASPNIGFLARDFHAPYSWNSTIGYRRELDPSTGIDMSFVYNRGEGAQMVLNVNPGLPGSANLTGAGYVRAVPTVGNANEYTNLGYTRYKGFRIELTRRMHRHLSGGVAYTLAKSDDNGYWMISTIQVPTHPELNDGPANFDIRHQLVSHVEAELPLGLQVAGILEFRSARPLNIVAGAYDVNGDGITGDWVNQAICLNIACPGFSYSRNSVRSLSTDEANRLRALFGLAPIQQFQDNPDFWNVDLTLRKQVTLGTQSVSVALEAFNLFNTYQYTQPVQDISSPLFGHRVSVVQPRTLQLGVRYRF